MRLDRCRINSTNIMRQFLLESNPAQPCGHGTNSRAKLVRYFPANVFCTSRCLESLLRGGKLDPVCPNVGDHGDEYHEISGEQFMDNIVDQITSQSPQFELQPLHIVGKQSIPQGHLRGFW